MIESLSHNLKEAFVFLRRRGGLITKSDEGEEGMTVEKLGSIGFWICVKQERLLIKKMDEHCLTFGDLL